MRHWISFACTVLSVWVCVPAPAQPDRTLPDGKLEIHYINVGQGGCTLIVGPDGTSLLYDFGNRGKGKEIVKYLAYINLKPGRGLDYTMVSHRDSDHYSGYAAVIDADYDVNIANYDSGSPKKPTAAMRKAWLDAAEKTSAGAVEAIKPGTRIPLGDGAIITVMAANGKVHSTDSSKLPTAKNENDRSISLYLKYGQFDYVLDGDLGSGREACTEHDTDQQNFQVPVARALIAKELMKEDEGVDVLHIAHHGSESSTSAAYYNLMKPEVGLISVGLNQGTFYHPRVDVVEKILLGDNRPDCVVAPPLEALFQTEQGVKGTSSTGSTSFKGKVIGHIRLVTDGHSGYYISGVHEESDGTLVRTEYGHFDMDDKS